MKMKSFMVLIVLVMSISLLAGCGNDTQPTPTPDTTSEDTTNETEGEDVTTPTTDEDTTTSEEVDAVTTASIVNKEEDFEKALSKDGTWIIASLKDLTFENDLVLEGEFKNKGEVQRKIALYTQDENRTVTNRFAITAPSLTIKSPAASIQHGTFKGDLYVETNDFKLVDTKVDGNIYFTSEEAKTGFEMDEDSSVTGATEVKE